MALPSPLPDEPDPLETLLGRVAIGDRQALRAVYELSAPKLFGLALRITGKRDLAEDVVQESFVSIWHHAGDYRPQLAAPMTWMTTIVRNRALDALRRTAAARLASATPLDDAPEADLADAAAGPAELAQASQQARALNRCLQRLEPGQRQAIVQAYLHDMSHSELAARMHAPLGTIKSWIRRGLERLRACLESAP
ncbi:sigma-70 family RNA polymerase sigma factor [Cupriavidus pauculus]|uniref:sigma-70 family RNA polymerase sigma factor n=1 Tax=Cupriavidus pauculus TaxID=82633 RepID=UPI0021559CEB|nr:sigma-70 family RNA polymerase sigma factor [Cupriavidus pauculus]